MSHAARPSIAHVAALESRRLLSASLVADVSPGGLDPLHLTAVEGRLSYFSGKTAAAGRELWATDGTPRGTWMLADLAPGAASANPVGLTLAGRYLFFAIDRAGDAPAGLYRTDGTSKGTIRLRDLGAAGDFANAVHAGRNAILFQLPDGSGGRSLWRSDGTAKGTVRVVKGGLPAFSEVAASPDTGEMIGVGGKGDATLYASDGTAAGTRRIDFAADRYEGLTSAGGRFYFVADLDRAYGLYTLADGRVTKLSEQRAVGLSSDPYSDHAWGLTFDTKEEGSFARYADGRATAYAYFDERGKAAKLAYSKNIRIGGNRDDAVFIRQENYDASIWATDDADRSLRYVARVALKALDGVTPFGDAIYAMGDLPAGGSQLLRIDRATGKSRVVLESPYGQTNANEDGSSFSEGGGRLLFNWKDEANTTDVYAIDAATGRVERLAGPVGSAQSSQVFAAGASAGGRTLILGGHAESGMATLTLVDAAGTARRLWSELLAGIGYAPEITDASVVVRGERAYVTFVAHGAKLRRFLFGVDLQTGATESLRKTESTGALRAVTATGRAYFDVDGQLRTTAGTAASVRGIAKLTSATGTTIRNAATAGERLVFTTDNGLYAASPDGTTIDRLRRSDATPNQPILSVVGAGAYAYATHGDAVYRTDGTAAGTVAALQAGQVAAGLTQVRSILASGDGKWLYAFVATRDDDAWRIVRLATDGGTIETILARPNDWASDAAPWKLLAAGGDDLVAMTGTGTLYGVRVSRKTIRLLQHRREGFDYKQTLATPDAVLLTATKEDAVLRLKGGALRPVDGLRNAYDTLLYASGSAYAVMDRADTGTELFRYRLDTSIVGTIYGDLDADQSRDASERGLAGWRVYVDRNDNGRWDKDELNFLTDETGRFEFFELDAGSHKLRVSTGPNHAMTTGTVYTVKLKAGQTVTKRFGARPIV